MSGTSLDGIDAALIQTDGLAQVKTGPAITVPYSADFRRKLRAVLGQRSAPAELVAELTRAHAEAVAQLQAHAQGWGGPPGLIGFHGQTLFHAPDKGLTVQIGDGALLARLTGIPVVNDFRSADVRAGGQGAPLVPLYHQALAAPLERPLMVLNIGGVANITWLGRAGEVLACDTGPGNALLDDWMLRHTGTPCDENGALAAQGRVDPIITKITDHPFFYKPLPKSLDRDAFAQALNNTWSVADGAASLTYLTALCVAQVLPLLPEKPQRILVTGGGRHNPVMMRFLSELCQIPAQPVEKVGWQGDALEAQAFAYLAVRARLGLPLSLPGTTGVQAPLSGGVYFTP